MDGGNTRAEGDLLLTTYSFVAFEFTPTHKNIYTVLDVSSLTDTHPLPRGDRDPCNYGLSPIRSTLYQITHIDNFLSHFPTSAKEEGYYPKSMWQEYELLFFPCVFQTPYNAHSQEKIYTINILSCIYSFIYPCIQSILLSIRVCIHFLKTAIYSLYILYILCI